MRYVHDIDEWVFNEFEFKLYVCCVQELIDCYVLHKFTSSENFRLSDENSRGISEYRIIIANENASLFVQIIVRSKIVVAVVAARSIYR